MRTNGQLGREQKPAIVQPAMPGALLTVEEVAALLQVDASWVYERVRRRAVDRLPAYKLGKYWRFRETDVLAWLERQRVGEKPNA